MLTPAQRKEVEKLIEVYDTARTQLQNHLETVVEGWGEEIVADDTDARSDFMLDQVVYRVDCVGNWICKLIEGKIELSEIDKVFTFDDEE